jgi:hypothetical protein
MARRYHGHAPGQAIYNVNAKVFWIIVLAAVP